MHACIYLQVTKKFSLAKTLGTGNPPEKTNGDIAQEELSYINDYPLNKLFSYNKGKSSVEGTLFFP